MMLRLSPLSPLTEFLSEFLAHEAVILSTVERRVEDIGRELMHIQEFLKDIESRGHVEKEGFDQWVDRLRALARDAEDVIQTFVDISVQRRNWIFSLVDRHNVGKQLEQVRKRVKETSNETMSYYQSQQTNIDVVVNVVSPNTTQAPAALEKLSSILSQDLIVDFKVKNIVQEVRDEVVSMLNVVSNLKSKEVLCERERVWLEEADTLTNFIISVTEGFIARTRRRHWFCEGILMCFLLFFRTYTDLLLSSETKLMWEMEYIKTQVRGALRRRLTYVVGEEEEDVGDQISMVRSLPSPLELILVEITSIFPPWINMFIMRSKEHNFESIKRDLTLMHALFEDIRDVEGLNIRQQVWVKQIREVARHAESFLAAYEPRMNQYNWFVCRVFQPIVTLLICDEGISDILYKMNKLWERKTSYDIGNIEGRKSIVSQGQSIQGNESGSERQGNDNSGNGEDPPLAAGMSNNYPLVKEYTKEAVQSIRGELQLINALFGDADQMGELDGRSKIWVEQMKDIAAEIESVSNDYASKWEDKSIHVRIFNILALFDINLKINKITNKIQETRRMRKRYGSIHIQTRAESSSSEVHRLRGRTQPPLNVRESNTVGVEEDVEVLTKKLLSNEKNRCIISLIGIEGIGKKELAKLIFDNADIKGYFDYRVCISAREGSVKRVVEGKRKQIMSNEKVMWTGKEDSTHTLETFMKMKGCLCLIVVEDIGVETPIVWDTLKKTIPDMSTGCTLLLTSCNAKVAELHAGPRSFVHHIQLLDDENSWVLFKRNLRADIPGNVMKVAEDIAKTCGGLPSEILKIGKELSKKHGNEWSSMLQEVNQYRKPWSENTIDNLPLYLRRCLSYFVLFPAEFEIPTRRLIVLWVAEGLVHQRKEEEPPEQVAERYLSELIDLNMVQIAKRKRNGKVKTCRLPNALRQSSFLQHHLSINLVAGHPSTGSDSARKRPIIRQVADHLDEKDICYNHIHCDTTPASASLKSSYKNVLSFLSFDAQEGSKPGQDIGKFLNRCISSGCFLLLRVLDLERVYKPQLPENIARLSQLRYLGLRWTYLESLPSSISSLLKLQTLDLKHTYISVLTSSIWKMQLRHLFLSETYRSRFPPHPKGNSLSDLQTLWGLFVDEKTPVKGGLDRLVNIRKLGLACQSMSLDEEEMRLQLLTVDKWIMELKYLQSLRLKSRKEDGQPGDLYLGSLETHADLTDMYLLGVLKSSSINSVFPQSLIELTLSHSKLQEDSIGILGRLPKLQSLCLLAGSYTEETLHCKKGSFPQLRVLKLWKLEEIKQWNIEEEALPCLRQLEIRSCECLEMLPGGLKHVNTLLELKLTNMPESFNNGVDKDKLPRFCRVTKFPVRSNLLASACSEGSLTGSPTSLIN